MFSRHGVRRIAKWRPLQCAKSVLDGTGGAFSVFTHAGLAHAGFHEPVVTVGGHGLAAGSAEQFVARHTQRFALDVPTGDLDR